MSARNELRSEAMRARGHVHSAVKAGILVKPEACTNCGAIPLPGKDGRSRLHAHHHDGHENHLSIQWICAPCHRRVTPYNPAVGEACNLAKLTSENVREIRASKETNQTLSQRYGVSKGCIKLARNRRSWKWLD